MELILGFLSGMFLVNGIPHFVKGITGQTHMTPFKRVSSASLNIIWAFSNFVIGLWLLNLSGKTLINALAFDAFSWSFLLGAFIMAWGCAWLFSNPKARFPWHTD